MASFSKFQPFVAALANGTHNLGSNQLTVALTNSTPSAANSVLADITQISYTNCSSRNITTTSSTQSGGTYKLILVDLTLTASGTVGPFQYVVIYNSTASGGPLIGYYDYGSSITMNSGDTFAIDFSATNGLIQLT